MRWSLCCSNCSIYHGQICFNVNLFAQQKFIEYLWYVGCCLDIGLNSDPNSQSQILCLQSLGTGRQTAHEVHNCHRWTFRRQWLPKDQSGKGDKECRAGGVGGPSIQWDHPTWGGCLNTERGSSMFLEEQSGWCPWGESVREKRGGVVSKDPRARSLRPCSY